MTKIIKVQKKRRRKNITDYNARLTLLKSDITRVVIRKTNRYVIIQIVDSKNAQDKIIYGLTSKELISEGWNEEFIGSLRSVPACYLTGILFANKIDKDKKYIVDLGMARTIKGPRLFETIKGLIDGGLKISANEKVFPSKESLEGKYSKEDIKENIRKVREKLLGKSEDKKEIKQIIKNVNKK